MKWILFGTGMASQKLMNYPLRPGKEIIAVVDNNSQKWGVITMVTP